MIPRFEDEYGFHQPGKALTPTATDSVATIELPSDEHIRITDAALIKVINQYCGHEAGVRNLRKCLDRIFRKIVAKMEDKKLDAEEITIEATPTTLETGAEGAHQAAAAEPVAERVMKEYQVNTLNLEQFLDVPQTDDHYYQGINQKLPVGSSNGLAYVDDG